MASGSFSVDCVNDRGASYTKPKFYCDWSSTAISDTVSRLTINWRVYAPYDTWKPYDYRYNNFKYTLSTSGKNIAIGTSVGTETSVNDNIPNHMIAFNTRDGGGSSAFNIKDVHPANATEAGYVCCGNYTGNDGYTFRTDTFTITHKDNGTATVTIYAKVVPDTGVLRYGEINNVTITLDTLVSACSYPTSIKVNNVDNPTVVSGNVTVSWSGASAGNNNPISFYRVYYSTSNNVSTSSSYQDSSGATASITFNASSKGATYYFKVKTIGSKSGYDSGLSSAQATCVVNQIPGPPTISDSNRTITSSESVTLTLTRGSNTTGWSSTHICYNWSNSHSGETSVNASSTTVPINTTNLPQGQSATLYVWTSDGHEYSTVSTRTITRNSKPTFVFDTPSYTNGYSAKGTTYYKSIEVKGHSNKNCTGTIKLYKGNSQSQTTLIKTVSNKNLYTTSNSSVDTYNLLTELGTLEITDDIYLKIEVIPNDGREAGDSVTYTNASLVVPGPSTSDFITYDQFANTNLVDGSHCGKKIRVKCKIDASVPMSTLKAKVGSKQKTTVVTATSQASGYNILDYTISDTIDANTPINFEFILSSSDHNVTKKITFTRTTLVAPGSMGSFKIDGNSDKTIDMFTGLSDNIKITLSVAQSPCKFTNGAIVVGNEQITNFKVYKGNSTSGDIEIASSAITVDPANVSKGAELKITIPIKTFAQFGEFGKGTTSSGTYNGVVTAQVRLEFYTIYGEPYIAGPLTYYLNYNEDVEFDTTAQTHHGFTLYYGTNSILGGSDRLQESMVIYAGIDYKAYSASTITAKLYYKIGTGAWVLASTATSVIINTNTGSQSYNQGLKTGSIVFPTYTIPQITSNSSWYWKVELTSTVNKNTKKTTAERPVLRQVSPTITCTWDETPYTRTDSTRTFNIETISYNSGTNATLYTSGSSLNTYTYQYYVCDAATSARLTNAFTSAGDINEKAPYTNWGQRSVKVECVVTVTGLAGQRSYNTYSSIKTLYTIQPTLAYRNNQIGINNTDVANDGVVDIYGTTNKKVLYIGKNTTTNNRIVIHLEDLYIDIV